MQGCVSRGIVQNTGLNYASGFQYLDNIFSESTNIQVPIDEWQMQGFQRRDSQWALSHAYGSGTIQVNAPKGSFHLGFRIYDGEDNKVQQVVVEVNGRRVGTASVHLRDNRPYLYFTDKAYDFNSGDKVTLRVSGQNGRIEGIVFLANPPERYRIEGVASQFQEGGWPCRDNSKDIVRLVWTTNWPAIGEVKIEGEGTSVTVPFNLRSQNHRLDWDGFEPGTTYKWTIKTTIPSGQVLTSGPHKFVAALPREPLSISGIEKVALPVTNDSDKDVFNWPVKVGVPFPQGELGSTSDFQIISPNGESIASQGTVLSRWPDNSIKWLLAEFMADVSAKETEEFVLRYGRDVTNRDENIELIKEADGLIQVNTGLLKLVLDPKDLKLPGQIWVNPSGDGIFTDEHRVTTGGEALISVSNTQYTTIGPVEEVRIESKGPVRATIYVRGHHRNYSGDIFLYEARIHAWHGSSFVMLEYLFGNDNPEKFTLVDSLSLDLPFTPKVTGVKVGGSDDDHSVSGSNLPIVLSQMIDHTYNVTGINNSQVASGERAPGWFEVSTEDMPITIACRYFWENYPKAVEVDSDGLKIDLMPPIEVGQYADEAETEVEETRLFFHLHEGGHKLKEGMNRRHDILLAFGHSSDNIPMEYVNTSLRASVPRKQYVESKVFGEMSQEPGYGSQIYGELMRGATQEYLMQREVYRTYGMIHFGDWWGERNYNWGNLEYDTPQAFFQTYVHTGDDLFFILGEQAALHQMDIDVIRQHSKENRVGFQHEHCMGHVGDYWASKPLGDGVHISTEISNIGHVFNYGLVSYYHLTGDSMALETAIQIADYYANQGDGTYTGLNRFNNYDFKSAPRFASWPALLFLSVYESTGDPYYLNASRIIMDRVMEKQLWSGGWLEDTFTDGYCYCKDKKCKGSATFMTGLLMHAMVEYRRIAEDDMVAPGIVGSALYLMENTYEGNGLFRITTCPTVRTGVPDHICAGLAEAYYLSENEDIKEALLLGALRTPSFNLGKNLSAYMHFVTGALKLLDESYK